MVARVVEPVAEDGPIPFRARLENLGVMYVIRHVEGYCSLNAMLVQNVDHSPNADPISIIAYTVIKYIRMRCPWPGIARSLV